MYVKMLLKAFSVGYLVCTPVQTHAPEHLTTAIAELRQDHEKVPLLKPFVCEI